MRSKQAFHEKHERTRKMADLLFKDEVYAIMGAAMEVYKELGTGFLEAVYQEALEFELQSRQIPFEAQHCLTIFYKGRQLAKGYVADIVCYGTIVVELKALNRLSTKEESQLLNYLKATGKRVGLLINFGATPLLEWKRFVR
jgi:GxxExxY protein